MKYDLLPFRFSSLNGRRIISNDVGDYAILDEDVFCQFISGNLESGSSIYFDLEAKHFLCQPEELDYVSELLACRLLTKNEFLKDFTSLHMVAVTRLCNHRCQYCQVGSIDEKSGELTMSPSVADAVLDVIYKTPSDRIKIEFQGGEPLIAKEIILRMLDQSESLRRKSGKSVEYVICTNLSLVNQELLKELDNYDVYLSSSLDGPKDLHDANRPLNSGKSSYEAFVQGLQLARDILGQDRVSALLTLTGTGFLRVREIVDEYLEQGFESIFLRSLNPYGRAANNLGIGYSADEFLVAYKDALAYIIDINLGGRFFAEEFATLILRKILLPASTSFVDLQSPSGLGIACALYNYDGSVYASDESRMLGEMGDFTFRLGNVLCDEYAEMFGGGQIRTIARQSILEGMPICSDCAFLPYCGSDPIRNFTRSGDLQGIGLRRNQCEMTFPHFCGRSLKWDSRFSRTALG